MAQSTTIGTCRRSYRTSPDEAKSSVDAHVRLVTKDGDRNHWQQCAIGAISNLAAGLQCLTGINTLLYGLIGFVRPDIFGRLARFHCRLLVLGVAPPGGGNERGIDDPAGHGDVALLL